MDLRIRTNQHVHVIGLEGDIHLIDSTRLKELVMGMIDKHVERFIIDAGKVSSIDSNGIGAFIFISSTLKKLGLPLAIANVHGPVQQVIDKINLASYFPIYENLDEAIQKLSQ